MDKEHIYLDVKSVYLTGEQVKVIDYYRENKDEYDEPLLAFLMDSFRSDIVRLSSRESFFEGLTDEQLAIAWMFPSAVIIRDSDEDEQ